MVVSNVAYLSAFALSMDILRNTQERTEGGGRGA